MPFCIIHPQKKQGFTRLLNIKEMSTDTGKKFHIVLVNVGAASDV